MGRNRLTISDRFTGGSRDSAIILGFCALQFSACASTSDFSSYHMAESSRVRDEKIFFSCRAYARHLVRNAAQDPIENIQNGKGRMASIVGSGVGDRILFSRAVNECMEANGYVRGDARDE